MTKQIVENEVFECRTLDSWECIFNEASEFASKIEKDRLISISHSQIGAKGMVVVWYWTKE